MYTRPLFQQNPRSMHGFGTVVTTTTNADGTTITETARFSDTQKTIFRALLAAGVVTVGAIVYFHFDK